MSLIESHWSTEIKLLWEKQGSSTPVFWKPSLSFHIDKPHTNITEYKCVNKILQPNVVMNFSKHETWLSIACRPANNVFTKENRLWKRNKKLLFWLSSFRWWLQALAINFSEVVDLGPSSLFTHLATLFLSSHALQLYSHDATFGRRHKKLWLINLAEMFTTNPAASSDNQSGPKSSSSSSNVAKSAAAAAGPRSGLLNHRSSCSSAATAAGHKNYNRSTSGKAGNGCCRCRISRLAAAASNGL